MICPVLLDQNICGEPELTDNQRTLLNPLIIIEVLSPSTRDYDRVGKFTHYRSIAGLPIGRL